jgi:hypothetical protein
MHHKLEPRVLRPPQLHFRVVEDYEQLEEMEGRPHSDLIGRSDQLKM